jgi:hypothetical protein
MMAGLREFHGTYRSDSRIRHTRCLARHGTHRTPAERELASHEGYAEQLAAIFRQEPQVIGLKPYSSLKRRHLIS